MIRDIGSEMFSGCTKRSPLLQIGQNIPVGPNGCGYIESLYVMPSGQVVIAEAESSQAQGLDYAEVLRQWDAEHLDTLAEDYTFHRYGQAYRIIDLMAKAGYLTFADETALTDAINHCLSDATVLSYSHTASPKELRQLKNT